MIALAIVIGILAAIAFLRVGADFEFSDEGITLQAVVGFVKIHVYPARKKGKKQEKPEKEDKPKQGGKFSDFMALLPEIKKALIRLKHKLTINELKLYYLAAGGDAAQTALSFGRASAGLGVLIPVLENNFKIKDRDFRTSVSFNESEPYLYIKARLSLAVWELLYIAAGPIVQIIKNAKTKNRKAEKANG